MDVAYFSLLEGGKSFKWETLIGQCVLLIAWENFGTKFFLGGKTLCGIV